MQTPHEYLCREGVSKGCGRRVGRHAHPAAVRCDRVLHRVFFARDVYEEMVFGGEVRHGVASGVSREISLNDAFARSKNQRNINKSTLRSSEGGRCRGSLPRESP